VSHFLRTAEAKGGPYYHRQAEVTADGRYLLISGSLAKDERGSGLGPPWDQRPAGLIVVETKTMSVVLRDADVGSFELTPDGRWLLGTGAYRERGQDGEQGGGGLIAHGLKVFDLDSLEVAAHLWQGEEIRSMAVSADGRYAFLTRDGPGVASRGPAGGTLSVVDLRSLETIAERVLPESHAVYSIAPAR
jgi:hypothetical protein